MENIWDTDVLTVEIDNDGDLAFTPTPMINANFITIPPEEVTAFAQHWLDLEGFDLVKREPEPDIDRIFATSMLIKWLSGKSISDESKKLINEKLGLVFRDDLTKRRLPKVDELTDEQKGRLVKFYDTLLDGELGEELADYFSKFEPETNQE
jgi:hypothetical protein